ncbi:early nodulin-like protein 1 [Andrographis paniculata]|uniref:early nodulin-like protein 1 n=1 Tax=Andrographis paniculata TaxID=175694 RepID=UPI0021E7486E|nr:early nodulin-like protein 1 [Andrographis paniculata]
MASISTLLLSLLLIGSMAAAAAEASGFQFEVAWRKPTGMESETYNDWAARNRFRIGDSIQFKYQNDSVLEVSPADYRRCESSNPISESDDGGTVMKFERSGLFYFISGNSDHCQWGQRLIVRVMHLSEEEIAAPAPAPATHGGMDSGEKGTPAANSTAKISVVSYLVTAFIGLFVVFYIFM